MGLSSVALKLGAARGQMDARLLLPVHVARQPSISSPVSTMRDAIACTGSRCTQMICASG